MGQEEKEAEEGRQTDRDIVCPRCFKQLEKAAIAGPAMDRYKRTTRQYFAWCTGCTVGFEVVQFLDGERWHIHKFRFYKIISQKIRCEPYGWWQTAADLPEPAPVVIGPGGDYDRGIKLR